MHHLIILKWHLKRKFSTGQCFKFQSFLNVPSPTRAAQTLPQPDALPPPSHTVSELICQPKAHTGSLPPMPWLSCASTQLGSISHPFFFFFFATLELQSSGQRRDRLWSTKEPVCFCLLVPASLSSNHKAELSPELAVGGATGQEPCKQMPDADDHVSYLT